MAQKLFDLRSFDHVGIRVSDAKSALAFYERLGFAIELRGSGDRETYELVNSFGVRINLICNADSRERPANVLLDSPVKYPGYTHAAFVVESLEAVRQTLEREHVRITEGPIVEERRTYLFFRDPDGNVIEVNELLPAGSGRQS